MFGANVRGIITIRINKIRFKLIRKQTLKYAISFITECYLKNKAFEENVEWTRYVIVDCKRTNVVCSHTILFNINYNFPRYKMAALIKYTGT